MAWLPRRIRDDPDAIESYLVPHEGVPPWLRAPLLSWVSDNFRELDAPLDAVRYFISLSRIENFQDSNTWRVALENLLGLCAVDGELLLDVVDFQLSLPAAFRYQDRSSLGTHLAVAGSVYEVGGGPDSFRLERRVAKEDRAAFETASNGDSSSAHHLRSAWDAAFSRSPDPEKAYHEALRSVEAAMTPIVVPRDGSATLGNLINALDTTKRPAPVEVRLTPQSVTRDPVDAVGAIIALLRLLQQGQRGRHGVAADGPPPQNTVGEAQDAVMIAVLLVNLCRTGGIMRRTGD